MRVLMVDDDQEAAVALLRAVRTERSDNADEPLELVSMLTAAAARLRLTSEHFDAIVVGYPVEGDEEAVKLLYYAATNARHARRLLFARAGSTRRLCGLIAGLPVDGAIDKSSPIELFLPALRRLVSGPR